MSLATDLDILVTRGLYYQFQYSSMDLFARGLHDMTFGTTSPKRNPHRVYTDFHVHIHRESDPQVVIREAAKRVDIVAITGRTEDFAHNHHTLDTFFEKCKEENVKNIDRLGENVLVAEVNKKPLYIVRATEVYPKEMLGVVSVGGKLQEKYETHGKGEVADAIADAKDHAAFWFIDHPFSIAAPVIAFRYPTKDEVKKRVEIFTKYDAIIEVANHQNTWWMYLSNEIARRVVEKYNLVGIGNSDTHFRAREIGLTRTSFPRALLDTATEERFLASLTTAFSRDNQDTIAIQSGFASNWSFGNYMVVAGKIPAYGKCAVQCNI